MKTIPRLRATSSSHVPPTGSAPIGRTQPPQDCRHRRAFVLSRHQPTETVRRPPLRARNPYRKPARVAPDSKEKGRAEPQRRPALGTRRNPPGRSLTGLRRVVRVGGLPPVCRTDREHKRRQSSVPGRTRLGKLCGLPCIAPEYMFVWRPSHRGQTKRNRLRAARGAGSRARSHCQPASIRRIEQPHRAYRNTPTGAVHMASTAPHRAFRDGIHSPSQSRPIRYRDFDSSLLPVDRKVALCLGSARRDLVGQSFGKFHTGYRSIISVTSP